MGKLLNLLLLDTIPVSIVQVINNNSRARDTISIGCHLHCARDSVRILSLTVKAYWMQMCFGKVCFRAGFELNGRHIIFLTAVLLHFDPSLPFPVLNGTLY